MSVQTKLLNIQAELKAPMNQYNQFGRYKYRNCEDILKERYEVHKLAKGSSFMTISEIRKAENME